MALDISVDLDSPLSDGTRRLVIGTLQFSGTYTAITGETFDPREMGLNVLDALIITQPLVPVTSRGYIAHYGEDVPIATTRGGTPPGHITVFGGGSNYLTELSNGADLTDFSARFLAVGS